MTNSVVAAVLVLSVLVLAGCASTTADYTAGGSSATIEKGAQSGGAHSVSGWELADGKLQYKVREYGGRGGRRR